ncbi:leucine-rich repeat-containing protein 1-like isoform X2 [Pseudomyrmex gracilis]|nr:leucine-rich repeat-containing protein 1-like isoform X2 [Pseudomyrmex gracilis]
MALKIYFQNPFHGLIISTTEFDPLKQFFYLVKMMSEGFWYTFHKILSSIESDNFTSELTTEIGKKRKYSSRESFPRTTKTLNLRKSNITEFHPQVFLSTPTFHTLRELILTNNQISFLPKELGTVPHLNKLLLSHNCLGNTCLEIAKWEWMEQTAISQSLKELHIDNNNLTKLPLQIGKLQSLICLNVSQNLLTKLPQIIGTLQHLASLNVVGNPLLYLPGSMRGMELELLFLEDYSYIDFLVDEYTSPTPKVMSLMDLGAKTVKKYRIPYNDLPSKLVRYLDNSKFCCICRMPCFHSDIKTFERLLDTTRCERVKCLYKICDDKICYKYKLPLSSHIPFKCYFCSSKCYVYYVRHIK